MLLVAAAVAMGLWQSESPRSQVCWLLVHSEITALDL